MSLKNLAHNRQFSGAINNLNGRFSNISSTKGQATQIEAHLLVLVHQTQPTEPSVFVPAFRHGLSNGRTVGRSHMCRNTIHALADPCRRSVISLGGRYNNKFRSDNGTGTQASVRTDKGSTALVGGVLTGDGEIKVAWQHELGARKDGINKSNIGLALPMLAFP